MSNTARHILVAEDNGALASVICLNLERAGFRVTVACNGRIAWEAAQEEFFDLVVTDLQMPEMTGCEFCEELRTLERYQGTPVIMLTAKGTHAESPCSNANLNICETFLKPFSPKEIVEAVQRQLVSAGESAVC
jgi:DNA-binding response OmpR family regulator